MTHGHTTTRPPNEDAPDAPGPTPQTTAYADRHDAPLAATAARYLNKYG